MIVVRTKDALGLSGTIAEARAYWRSLPTDLSLQQFLGQTPGGACGPEKERIFRQGPPHHPRP